MGIELSEFIRLHAFIQGEEDYTGIVVYRFTRDQVLVAACEDKAGRERERQGSTNLFYAWRVCGKTRRGIPYEA